jgi:signal transduction histidine kinase
MSYRTIKKLLGETSLERKCRFLFGGGLMLLITGSFYFYAQLTANVVDEQNKTMARLLIPSIVAMKHREWISQTSADEPRTRIPPHMLAEMDRWISQASADEQRIRAMTDSLKPPDMQDTSGTVYRAHTGDKRAHAAYPPDDLEQDILSRLLDNEPDVVDIVSARNEYNYYAPVRFTTSCADCHHHNDADLKEGDLLGMVKISFPLEKTQNVLKVNNAILWMTAVVTTLLAMFAAYAIVRYVIVKPVLHLKDVSDKIARGMLDLRADIRTGDEFEELSHAFNRMLRHLTTVQDELREVNTDLDCKVDELAQVNLRLYEMNKLKDDFLAAMSHELRTPLNSILGFSDIVAGADNLSDKQKRFVQNIQTSGRELMLLINDLLDLAKIESGKMALQIVEFTVDDLVAKQVNSMMPLAAKKNIDLSFAVDPALPAMLQDSGKMQQILNNLLSNAIKFTPEGGRVQVRVGRFDKITLELIVEDTGIGIALEEQETIFEKFRQGKTILGQHDTMTRLYSGTGLGLSIVKELSKLLGGEVLLDSEFGKGSTFRVRFPFRLEEPSPSLDAALFERVADLSPAAARVSAKATEPETPGEGTQDEDAA